MTKKVSEEKHITLITGYILKMATNNEQRKDNQWTG